MPEPINRDEAVVQVARLILDDEKTRSVEWDAISLVIRASKGQKGMHGYRFFGDDWEAFLPGSGFDIIRLMKRLQATMAEEDGREWHQALIQMTKMDDGTPKIDIAFEYDDPQRWSVGQARLDLEGFAGSLKPQAE